MTILDTHRIEAHGNSQVCQDRHKDIGSGRVAADIRDDHRDPSEDETGDPAREGGQVQPETSKFRMSVKRIDYALLFELLHEHEGES